MTNYKAYGLNLSKKIKDAIIEAHNDKTEITISLNYNELKGNDKLMLTNEQIDKIRKAIKDGKKDKDKRGVTIIKISKTQIKKAPQNILPEKIIKIHSGYYRGSIQECLQKNQIRYYGTEKVDQKMIQELIKSMPKRKKKVSSMDLAEKRGTLGGVRYKLRIIREEMKHERNKEKLEKLKEEETRLKKNRD